MHSVDAAVNGLDKVVLLVVPRDETVRFRNPGPLKFRQLRDLIPGSHVGPEDPRFLPHRISGKLDGVLESARRIFRGHVDASSFDVVLPAMIGATESVLFIAPEKKIGAAVSTKAVDESYAPGGVAKGHQLLP